MNLRGHHLLCIFGWQGIGYDENFSREMNEVVASLKKDDEILEPTVTADRLCRNCPHFNQSGCLKGGVDREAEIREHDKRVLSFLGIEHGKQISVSKLKTLISKAKPHEHLEALCQNCSWLNEGYCKQGLKQAST